MVRKSQSLVTGAQGHQPGQTCPQGGKPGRREGSPTKLRRKAGREPMEVVAWAQEKNQKAKFNCDPGWARRPCTWAESLGLQWWGGGPDHGNLGWRAGILSPLWDSAAHPRPVSGAAARPLG